MPTHVLNEDESFKTYAGRAIGASLENTQMTDQAGALQPGMFWSPTLFTVPATGHSALKISANGQAIQIVSANNAPLLVTKTFNSNAWDMEISFTYSTANTGQLQITSYAVDDPPASQNNEFWAGLDIGNSHWFLYVNGVIATGGSLPANGDLCVFNINSAISGADVVYTPSLTINGGVATQPFAPTTVVGGNAVVFEYYGVYKVMQGAANPDNIPFTRFRAFDNTPPASGPPGQQTVALASIVGAQPGFRASKSIVQL